MLLGYLMNDLLREYVASGEFTRRGKWLAALREAAMFYVPAFAIGMGCASALPSARPPGRSAWTPPRPACKSPASPGGGETATASSPTRPPAHPRQDCCVHDDPNRCAACAARRCSPMHPGCSPMHPGCNPGHPGCNPPQYPAHLLRLAPSYPAPSAQPTRCSSRQKSHQKKTALSTPPAPPPCTPRAHQHTPRPPFSGFMTGLSNTKVLGRAMVNTLGLIILVGFLGYGLVEVPRSLWNKGDVAGQLRFLQFKVAVQSEELQSARRKLEETLELVHSTDAQLREEARAASTQSFTRMQKHMTTMVSLCSKARACPRARAVRVRPTCTCTCTCTCYVRAVCM